MRGLVLVVCAAACGSSSGHGATHDAPPVPIDASAGSDSGGSEARCAAGQAAIDVTHGRVTCAMTDPAMQAALNNQCSVFLGQRDSCDGCTLAPQKYGWAGGDQCVNTIVNGTSTDSTCTAPVLGADAVKLFGLNTDGDVDGNDKLYASLHCRAPATSSVTAPCPPGDFVTGTDGHHLTCAPMASAVVPYMQNHCTLYFGWQDACDGCTTPPVKWGFASDTACMNGAGTDDTCGDYTLETQGFKLFGLSPDGNVDDNDKFYIGLRCTPGAPASSTTTTTCPAGQFVVAIAADGSFECESPEPAIAQLVADRCTIYFGWSDACNGCTTPPTKWGTVRTGACANGAGVNNTCGTFQLGGNSVTMFGLNTDGDVDTNDTFYVGWVCR